MLLTLGSTQETLTEIEELGTSQGNQKYQRRIGHGRQSIKVLVKEHCKVRLEKLHQELGVQGSRTGTLDSIPDRFSAEFISITLL